MTLERPIRPISPPRAARRADARFGAPRRPGFSLVELVVTLTIASVIASVGIVRYGNSLARYRADAAAARAVELLREAQVKARTRSTPQMVVFSEARNAFGIVPNRATRLLDDSGITVFLAASNYRAVLGAANLGGDDAVEFDVFGRPDSGGTIPIRAGRFNRTVTVNAETGRASVSAN